MDKQISDYTFEEFLQFVFGLHQADVRLYPTERSHTNALLEFVRLVGHPSGIDLIAKPNKLGLKDTPEAIVQEVRKWRAEQGLPGFKEA